MTFYLKDYLTNTVNYDFLNKFVYKKISKIPVLLNTTLYFKFKVYNFKALIMSLVVLDIVCGKKGSITKSKVSNVSLKLRKGSPVGCKVVLRKKESEKFLSVLFDNFVNIKHTKNIGFDKQGFSLSTVIPNVLLLPELESNYQFFKNLEHLNIKLASTAKTKNEFYFLLKSCKLHN